MMIRGTRFESNSAGSALTFAPGSNEFGGALYLQNSRVVVSNCSLLSNSAGSGGAISAQESSTVNFTGISNSIESNTATNGGAVQVC